MLTKFYNTFSLSSIDKELFNYFNINEKEQKVNKIILVQCVEDLYYYGLFGEIINSLRAKQKIRVEQYVPRALTLGSTSNISSFLKSIFFNNKLRDNKWIKLYNSYCDGIAYRHEGSTTLLFDIKVWFQAYRIYKSIRSKKQLLELVIDNIKVGDLIYDSYLRFKPAPTVNIGDIYLCIVIWQTIRNINITKKYFEKNKPFILLTSYSTYIQHGIAVRVAFNYNTKVYSLASTQKIGKVLTVKDYYHSVNFHEYKEIFNNLKNNRKKLLEKSKEALENRFSGTIDTATFYMKESAYKITNIDIPDVKDSIIIFLHDFFDSPHIYGDMIFSDFLEWIEFTIEILEKQNIPYFLKPHPNQVSDSESVIESLKIKYSNLKILSSTITNRQLVDGGINIGISVYGTVAHELVYMDVPVILCAENPHSSYEFCFEAKTIEEYQKLIKNYKTLKVINNAKAEVESFYYMHNLNKTNEELDMTSRLIKFNQYIHSNYDNININDYKNLLNDIKENQEFTKFIKELL